MKRTITRLVFLSLLYCLCCRGEAKPSVAIFSLENRSPNRTLNYLSDLLPDMISTQLSQEEFCTLVERTDVENALNEIIISRQGFVGKSERIRPGMVDISDYFLSGYFATSGENITVTFRLYNRKTGKIDTIDFTSAIKEAQSIVTEIISYIRKKVKPSEITHVVPSDKQESAILLVHRTDCFVALGNAAHSDSMYEHPYHRILLDGIKQTLLANGVDIKIFSTEKGEDEIPDEFSEFDSRYSTFIGAPCYRISIPPPQLKFTLFEVGKDNRTILSTRKEFISSFVNPQEIITGVSKYLLKSAGVKNIKTLPYSPELESLFFYENFHRQMNYGDISAAEKEIYKALYLYPDCSFYWAVLADTCYRIIGKDNEKAMAVYEIYLAEASWDKHRGLYSDRIQRYISYFLENRKITRTHILFALPRMENALSKAITKNFKLEHLAHLMGSLYILINEDEKKLLNLSEKELIPDEYLFWYYLANNLEFTWEERMGIASFLNYNRYKISFHKSGLSYCLSSKRLKEEGMQEKILELMYELTRKYPRVKCGYKLFRRLLEIYDAGHVEKCLEKISKDFPGSLAARYSAYLKLRQSFVSAGPGDREKVAADIAEIVCSILDDEVEMDSLLSERKSYTKLLDRESFNILFFEIYNRAKLHEKQKMMQTAPEDLKNILAGIKEGKVTEKKESESVKIKESSEYTGSVLLTETTAGISNLLRDAGFHTDVFSKDFKPGNVNKYNIYILNIADLRSSDAKNSSMIRTDILEDILVSEEKKQLVLILPHLHYSEKDALFFFEELNSFLERFNIHADRTKQVTTRAVVLSPLFNKGIKFHSGLKISSGISRGWERFFIRGYPLYSEEGEVLIKSSEEDYVLARKFLSGRHEIILSGNIHTYLYPPTMVSIDFYKYLVIWNIWSIIISDVLKKEIPIVPVPEIQKIYTLGWKLRLPVFHLDYRYTHPISEWINTSLKPGIPDINEVEDSAYCIKEYEKIAEETENPFIKAHCFYAAGMIYRNISDYEKASVSMEKSVAVIPEDFEERHALFALLADTILHKEDVCATDFTRAEEIINKLFAEEKYSIGRLYDLKGRFYEKSGKYGEAAKTYKEMGDKIFRTQISMKLYLFNYALFRQAYFLYKQGLLTESGKTFSALTERINREFDQNFYAQFGSEIIPNSFIISAASYLYLNKISEKLRTPYQYSEQFNKLISDAENVKYGKEFTDLVKQIKALKEKHGI